VTGKRLSFVKFSINNPDASVGVLNFPHE